MKLNYGRRTDDRSNAGKYLKPYQGLKLKILLIQGVEERRKIPKTLSGIETYRTSWTDKWCYVAAGKYLKPYQGLKRNR